jgi:hypothetical protein
MTLLGGIAADSEEFSKLWLGEKEKVEKRETPKKDRGEVRNEPEHTRTPAKSPSQQ